MTIFHSIYLSCVDSTYYMRTTRTMIFKILKITSIKFSSIILIFTVQFIQAHLHQLYNSDNRFSHYLALLPSGEVKAFKTSQSKNLHYTYFRMQSRTAVCLDSPTKFNTVVKFQSQTTGRHLCIEKLTKKKMKGRKTSYKLRGSLVYRDNFCMWRKVMIGDKVAYESFGFDGYFLMMKRSEIIAKRTRRLSKGAKWTILDS